MCLVPKVIKPSSVRMQTQTQTQTQTSSLSSSAIKFNNDLAQYIAGNMAALVQQMQLLEAENARLRAENETLKNTQRAPSPKVVKHESGIENDTKYKIAKTYTDDYKTSTNETKVRKYYFMNMLAKKFGINGFTSKDARDYIKELNEEDQKNASIAPFGKGENTDLYNFRFDKSTGANYKTWDRSNGLTRCVLDYIDWLVKDEHLVIC